MKEPVASIRLLKRQRFSQVDIGRRFVKSREDVARDRERLRLFEARAGLFLVEIAVVSDHLRFSRIDFGPRFLFLQRSERADHPRRGRDLRPHHVDDLRDRHSVAKEVVERDLIGSRGAAAVFAAAVGVPRSESGLRGGVGLRAVAEWLRDSLRLVAGDAIVDDVVDRRRPRRREQARDRDHRDAREQPRLRDRLGRRIRDRLDFAQPAHRRGTDRNGGVGEILVGDEPAILDVQGNRDQHRNRERQARDARRDDVVRVARPEEEQRGVERVDGVVPDQQWHEAEAKQQEAEDDAGQPDLEAADEERLIGIGGVAEAPDESGKNDRE
jgi:hypothetical protein